MTVMEKPAPPADGVAKAFTASRRVKIAASLAPVLLLMVVVSTAYVITWRGRYSRVAAEKKRRMQALSGLEYARDTLDQAERMRRLPTPDHPAILETAKVAAEAAEEVLRIAPEIEEAQRIHGRALEAMYSFEEARAAYKECQKLHPETPARYHLGMLGVRELARARLSGLKTTLVDVDTLVQRADDPLRRYQASSPEMAKWMRVDFKARALCTLGEAYAVGDYATGPSNAGVVEGFDPTDWIVAYLEGLCWYEMKKYEDAARSFQKAARLAPGIADVRAWLGATLHQLKRRTEGIEQLTEAIHADEYFLEAYYLRGLLRFEDGRFGDARVDFANCVKLRPGLPELQMKLGVAAFENWQRLGRVTPDDLEAAAGALTSYLALQPRDPQGFILRGRVLLAKGDAARAEADLTAALALAPAAVEALLLRAEVQAAQKRWDESERDLATVIEKAVDAARAAEARRARARIRAAAGRFDDAAADLDALIAKDPNDRSLVLEKGSMLLRAGRLDDAAATAEKALAGEARNARFLLLRAEVLAARGDAAGAVRDATAALASDAQLSEALVLRGELRLKGGEKAKAAADLKQAMQMRPDLKEKLAPLLEEAERP